MIDAELKYGPELLLFQGVFRFGPAMGLVLRGPVSFAIEELREVVFLIVPGLDLRDRDLTSFRAHGVDDLLAVLAADEVFLTNSNWKVLPVVSVEQKEIADGKVGAMTQSLRDRVLAIVEEETTGD